MFLDFDVNHKEIGQAASAAAAVRGRACFSLPELNFTSSYFHHKQSLPFILVKNNFYNMNSTSIITSGANRIINTTEIFNVPLNRPFYSLLTDSIRRSGNA